MTKRNDSGAESAWGGTSEGVNAHLVPAAPPPAVEIGGAPVSDPSHEYVIRKKPASNAQD